MLTFVPLQYSLVHYGNVALLLVSLVTLGLFFATGMYSEKIAYAYKSAFPPELRRYPSFIALISVHSADSYRKLTGRCDR